MTRTEWPRLLGVAAIFAILYALPNLAHHRHYESSVDLATFDQAVWHMTRLEPPGSTISGYANILGDHFYPILALFTLPYWMAPVPETLIVMQALLLASAIVPVFVFLRRRLEFGASLALVIAFGLFWGMQRTALSDVHEMAFAPVLIAGALLAMDARRWGWLWVMSALLILTKEDLIPFVAACGAYLFWTGERRVGGWLAATGLASFVGVTHYVIPWFSDTGAWHSKGSFQSVFDRPWTAPLVLFTPAAKWRTVFLWLAPFACLPLLSPLGWLVWPIAVERLLSATPSHWTAGAHYSAPLAPILAMSAGDGLARLLARWPALRPRLTAGFVGTAVLLAAILPGHQPLWYLFAPRTYRALPDLDVAERALAAVPPAASVLAQAALTPRLSHRDGLFVLMDGAPEADYLISSSTLGPWPAASQADLARLIDDHRRRGYTTVFEERGWLVLKRDVR